MRDRDYEDAAIVAADTATRTIRHGSVDDIPDRELLRRAVSYSRPRRRGPRWSAVMEAFGLGSTYAAQLCRRYSVDPDETVKTR